MMGRENELDNNLGTVIAARELAQVPLGAGGRPGAKTPSRRAVGAPLKSNAYCSSGGASTMPERDFDPISLDEPTRRAARTYTAAADHYGRPALSFWDRWGAATVSRLGLASGEAVLDLCCGASGSAIPAARAVGANGRVVGVDIAVPLLELARAKAARERLTNVEFRPGDAMRTGLPGESFDAVVCVFGVFFAPDMPAFAAEMWRMVRPGGTLAITTWGPGWCEPASTVFWDSVRDVEASLYRRSTHGTRSPRRPHWPGYSRWAGSRTRASNPRRPSTNSIGPRTSGTSSSVQATGQPSTPSDPRRAKRYAITS
jgi:ubiquinone/menaquinone biosynthesis C-methylase UbiE